MPSSLQAPPASRQPWSFDYLTRHGWIPLAAILLALAGIFAFLLIARTVRGDAPDFDERLFHAIAGWYQHLPDFWQEVGRDITALGGFTVISLMTAAVTLFLLFMRQWKSAAFVLIAVLGGLGINLALKHFFDRARPDIFIHHSYTDSPSFPSGHASNSAVAYLTMAILLAKLVHSARLKAYVLAVGLAIPLLVGTSRVALAVHWPTDVIGGWLIGLAWGLLVHAAATYLQTHGGLESEGELAEEAEDEPLARKST